MSKDPPLFGGVPVLHVPPNSQILTIQIETKRMWLHFQLSPFASKLSFLATHSHECDQFQLQGKFLCLWVCVYICECIVWLVTKLFLSLCSGRKSVKATALIGTSNSIISSQRMTSPRKLEPSHIFFP